MSASSTARPSTADSTTVRWEPGPAQPRLTSAAVHVWRADLTTVDEELLELLSGDERERAARIVGERDRRLWRRSRGVLRALLAGYLQTDGGALRFGVGPHGKPTLLDGSTGRGTLSFNLSHSQHLALYAFTQSGGVGIDVQLAPRERRALGEVSLARRAFGAAEARRLEALEPGSRSRELLRLWTRHEATLKRHGTGLRLRPAESESWVAELDVGRRAAAAVSLERRPRELRCWDWPRRS
jgi:4'-phosphopantetheinyl transferase